MNNKNTNSHFPTAHIISPLDVLDMSWYACIGTNTMCFHYINELVLSETARRVGVVIFSLTSSDDQVGDVDTILTSEDNKEDPLPLAS